jgi:hypothetical protein
MPEEGLEPPTRGLSSRPLGAGGCVLLQNWALGRQIRRHGQTVIAGRIRGFRWHPAGTDP